MTGSRRWSCLATIVVVAAGCSDTGDTGSQAPPEAAPRTATAGETTTTPDTSAPPATPAPPSTDYIADAAWSPDGSRLAVTWDRGRGARLYGLLAGTDSTPPEPGRGLPLSTGRAAWASWAPHGLWVAHESRGDLYRMRPDGTFEEPLVPGPGVETQPAYSRDGRRLAFVFQAEGDLPVLWLAGADGSGAAPLETDLEGRFARPVWHPDGTLVAGVVSAEGPGIYAMDPGSGEAVRLVDGAEPAISPRGDWLYYVRNDSIFRRRWAASDAPDPSAGVEFIVAPGRAPSPAPDGLRLAFVQGHRPRSALYLLHLETGERLRLSEPPAPRP